MSGLFITFEGVEGAGKSTQVERLRARLVSEGHEVEVMREPGGVPIAEAIRSILLDPANTAMAATTELMLYEAARAQLVAERIRPALERNAVVICDRYVDSTIAYQGGGRGIPLETLRSLHDVATGALWPDVTLLLDVNVETGLKRARAEKELDRIEQESLEFHRRVHETFVRLATNEPGRITRIDAGQTIEQIEQAVYSAIEKALAKR